MHIRSSGRLEEGARRPSFGRELDTSPRARTKSHHGKELHDFGRACLDETVTFAEVIFGICKSMLPCPDEEVKV